MADDNRLIKVLFLSVIRIPLAQSRKTCLCTGNRSVKAFLQDFLVIHHQMPHTAVVIEVRLKNLLTALGAFFHLLIQVGLDFVIHCLSLPVPAQLYEFLPVLLAYEIELIVFPFLKGLVQHFVKHPVYGKLRVLGRCLGRCRNLPKD